jgi:hypothetical protein
VSSADSLVNAAGYKAKRGEKKTDKIKLKKLPLQVKDTKQVNGTHTPQSLVLPAYGGANQTRNQR